MLTRSEWERTEALFGEALGLPAAERRAHVRKATAGQPQIRAELEALLAAEEAAGDFLSRPVAVTPAPAEIDSMPPGTVLGPWRIVRPLGRGGMGEVYLAARADGAFALEVAVKLLKRGMDTDGLLRRFLRERRILAGLRHPHVAQLLDAGAAPDGRPYLVMEYVDGEPVTDWCARHGAGLVQVLRLMAAVCDAVHEAHRQLVVHRDLKPSNVLVNAAGEVKLLDFGIAKLLGEEQGEATLAAGDSPALTPAYAAPEQILGQPVTTATDVYALGAMLYQLLAGRPPHARSSLFAAAASLTAAGETLVPPSAAARRNANLGDARQRARELRGDLDLIVLKALRREPERRYRSAAELADDLRRFLAHRPVAARAESYAYVVRKFLRRNWLAASAGAAVLLALVAGAGLALWQAEHARAQARRAQAIKDFLLGVFEQADPERTQGATLTARELLAQGSESIEAHLRAEPAERADILEALARIHTSLGLYPRAAALAESSLALRRAHLRADHPQVADSLYALGAALQADSRMEPAEAALAEAQRIYTAAGDELALARSNAALSALLVNRGQFDRALALQQQSLDRFRRLRGDSDPETARQRLLLAQRLENAGRYAQAEQELREALSALGASLGPEHSSVGRAHLGLGSLLDRLGRPEESEQEHVLALAILRKVYGDSHRAVAEALFSQSIVLSGLGRFAEADQVLRETLRIYPPGSYDAAQSLRYLGVNLMYQERFDEAADTLAQAAAGLGRAGGPEDIQQYRALADQATARLRGGDARAAEPQFRRALAQLEKLAGPESYEVRNPIKRLGECLLTLQRYAEAVAMLRRARMVEAKLFGTEDHRDLAVTNRLLAEALLALDTPEALAEARAASDAALVLYRRHFPADLARPLALSGEVSLALGQRPRARRELEEALPLLRAELERAEREKPAGHPLIALRRARLAAAQRSIADLGG